MLAKFLQGNVVVDVFLHVADGFVNDIGPGNAAFKMLGIVQKER